MRSRNSIRRKPHGSTPSTTLRKLATAFDKAVSGASFAVRFTSGLSARITPLEAIRHIFASETVQDVALSPGKLVEMMGIVPATVGLCPFVMNLIAIFWAETHYVKSYFKSANLSELAVVIALLLSVHFADAITRGAGHLTVVDSLSRLLPRLVCSTLTLRRPLDRFACLPDAGCRLICSRRHNTWRPGLFLESSNNPHYCSCPTNSTKSPL